MRRRLILGVKNTQNRTAQRPREKGPLTRGRELPTLLASQKPLSFLWASFFLFSFALGDLFWDPQGDCLEWCGAFLSCDFGLQRTGSSPTVHSGRLDSLHSSSGTSSSSAWALGLKWNEPKPLEPSSPTIAPQNHATRLLGRGGGFWRSWAYIMTGWVLFPYGCQGFFVYPWHAPGASAYEVHCHQCFLFGDNTDRFGIRNVYSMAPLWNSADLEVENSLGNWAKFILLDIPPLSFVCNELP